MAKVVSRSPTSSPSNFNFNNLQASAPSRSPKPFGNPNDYFYSYTSAPTSPNRAASIYLQARVVDTDWEEMPMTPKLESDFDFGIGIPPEVSTAFNMGQMRPSVSSDGFRRHREVPCFDTMLKERGREIPPLSPTFADHPRSKREARSLSPSRVHSSSVPASPAPPPRKSNGSKKWRFKDLLLFRSSSEGRVTGRESKDPLRKYSLLSTPSPSSSSLLLSPANNKKKEGESSTKSGSKHAVSAHELHYTENRAASEEMKKKTPLPYNKNSFFGYLHFNPAVRVISRGFKNSSSFSRGRY